MIYELPTLPYRYPSLEPYIDRATMEIHFTKHHAGYVNNLNQLLRDPGDWTKLPLEEILRDISVVPEDLRQGVRNHGGGHVNHCLFWQIMTPDKNTEPSAELLGAISAIWGDLSRFQETLAKTALARFGSGWAWLCLNAQGKLEILSTPNQDSPLMQGFRPILGLDLWEHAYYLQYQNRRPDYIAAWWNVVNWLRVSELFAQERTAVIAPGLVPDGRM